MALNIRQRWERVKTVPGLGRDTAAVVLMVVAGVVSYLIMQSNIARAPWASTQDVKAEFAQVPGVHVESTNSVTIAGVKVGKISNWEATNRGTAILTLEIDPDHKVYDNARAILRPKNPLNDMA